LKGKLCPFPTKYYYYIYIDPPRNSLVAAPLTFSLRIFQLYNAVVIWKVKYTYFSYIILWEIRRSLRSMEECLFILEQSCYLFAWTYQLGLSCQLYISISSWNHQG
jgi:hypothetical protein